MFHVELYDDINKYLYVFWLCAGGGQRKFEGQPLHACLLCHSHTCSVSSCIKEKWWNDLIGAVNQFRMTEYENRDLTDLFHTFLSSASLISQCEQMKRYFFDCLCLSCCVQLNFTFRALTAVYSVATAAVITEPYRWLGTYLSLPQTEILGI